MFTTELIEQFRCGPNRLEAALAGLEPGLLDFEAGPNEWTIRQIVHHLADDGDEWSLFIKMAIAAPGAPIRFDWHPGNEAWVKALNFAGRDIRPALDLFRAHREYIAAVAAGCPHCWENTVTYIDSQGREKKRFTVARMLGLLIEHLDEHLDQIAAVRRAAEAENFTLDLKG